MNKTDGIKYQAATSNTTNRMARFTAGLLARTNEGV
jgi:hypothetical protein